MAISTYSELQAAVGLWLARDDIASYVADLIMLCETRLNRDLQGHGRLERRATIMTTAADAYIAVPDDFAGVRDLVITGTPSTTLTYLGPRDVSVSWHGVSGKPRGYFLAGRELRLAPTPDAAYTLEMIYYATVTALSDAAPTNDILTYHPDLYLFGTLAEAAPFLREDERIAVWEGKYAAALAATMATDRKTRWNAGPLVEPAGR